MARSNSEQNSDNDDLICPITMELFRDPVTASDGRVYERSAITQWIIKHGTSPFTRQPLQLNELQPDDHLRQLAACRRNSVVSYNVQKGTITLPPLRTSSRNARPIHSGELSNRTAMEPVNNDCNKGAICSCSIRIAIPLGIVFIVYVLPIVLINTIGKSHSSSTSSISSNIIFNTTTNFSNVLTTMSSTYTPPHYLTLSNSHYYIVRKVFINISGYYEIKSNSVIDLYGYLYNKSFNASNPMMNLLIRDNNSGGLQQFRVRLNLSYSSVYDLVITTFLPNVAGSFSVSVGGPATVIIQ